MILRQVKSVEIPTTPFDGLVHLAYAETSAISSVIPVMICGYCL
jgi:hypothetical protein